MILDGHQTSWHPSDLVPGDLIEVSVIDHIMGTEEAVVAAHIPPRVALVTAVRYFVTKGRRVPAFLPKYKEIFGDMETILHLRILDPTSGRLTRIRSPFCHIKRLCV